MKEMICIVCPMGCHLQVDDSNLDDINLLPSFVFGIVFTVSLLNISKMLMFQPPLTS